MTTYRAKVDFTMAELAGLSEDECRRLAEHTFIVRGRDLSTADINCAFVKMVVAALDFDIAYTRAARVVGHAFATENA